MASKEELDILVAEAVKTLRSNKEKVNSRSILKLVKHRTEDVLRAFNRVMDKERAEQEEDRKRSLSQTVVNAINKDREDYAESKIEMLKNEIDQLHCNSEILQEEIGTLREDLSAAQDQTSNDRDSYAEAIEILQQDRFILEGKAQALLERVVALQGDLSIERKGNSDATIKLSGMRQTLGVKSTEARSERARANVLQSRLDESEECLKTTRHQLTDEQKARFEAENRFAAAEATADALKNEIEALRKAKPPTRPPGKPTTKNNKGSLATK